MNNNPGYDDEGNQIVELFRNCICGSTLMELYSDRRDGSVKGTRRRALFGKLMMILQGKGLAGSVARTELLNMMQGERSEILERMGVKFNKS